MTGERHVAEVWLSNKRIIDDWLDDYCKRTGKKRSEVVAERRANWMHDPQREEVCSYKGFCLARIPYEGKHRYTVITPWDMNEGLGDWETDDGVDAERFFTLVVEEVINY